jgi:predicted signal transduction protein with EAL and GGDEF domain
MCYRNPTMAKRAGVTEKISVSLRASDLASLRRRAKRLYGGNLSAVIAELAADAELLEGMHALVERLGGPTLTDEDRDRLDGERTGQAPPPVKRARRRKASKAA